MPPVITGPGAVDRTAAVGHAVGGLGDAGRVEVPDDAPVVRGIGLDVSVQSSREDDTGDHCGPGRIGDETPLLPFARLLARRSVPHDFTRHQVEGVETRRGVAVGVHVDDDHAAVRIRDVGVPAVGGHPPVDAAEGAPLADLRRPQDRSVVVRVEGPDRAGLLAHHQDLLAVGTLHEHRRHAEVDVRSGRIRAVLTEGLQNAR